MEIVKSNQIEIIGQCSEPKHLAGLSLKLLIAEELDKNNEIEHLDYKRSATAAITNTGGKACFFWINVDAHQIYREKSYKSKY